LNQKKNHKNNTKTWLQKYINFTIKNKRFTCRNFNSW